MRERVLEQSEIAKLISEAFFERAQRLAEPPDFKRRSFIQVRGDQIAGHPG